MAFTVEDDTGLPNANAYIDVSYYDTYIGDRGRSDSDTNPTKQGRIVRATDWLDRAFRFRGVKESLNDQRLEFPRNFGVTFLDDADFLTQSQGIVPDEIKEATAEATWLLKDADLTPTPDASNVSRRSQDFGDLSESVSYRRSQAGMLRPAQIKAIIQPFLAANILMRV